MLTGQSPPGSAADGEDPHRPMRLREAPGGAGPAWPHVVEAARAACAALSGAARTQVVMACGTGKTRVGAEVSREVAPAGKVLVVVPTLELLAQTATVYARVLGAGAGLVGAVCSEAGATADAAGLREGLEHLHAGQATDPGQIAGWLAARGRVTVLTTYQSLPVIEAAHRRGAAGWDLAVVDEAHRSAGLVERSWSIIHDDARIPAGRRLYMTATPRLLDSDRFEVFSMDDAAVYGAEAFRLPFGQAIEAGLLADYRLAVMVVTDQETASMAAAQRIVSAGGPAVPAGMLAAQVALLRACAQWELRRVITYHHRVAASRRFAQTLLNAGDLLDTAGRPQALAAWAVDGSMPLWQRREVLDHLRRPGGSTVVVANARVLSEGVDVPELDGVMFADPRDSTTDVVQAIGRALRLGSRARKTATIIVPVVLSAGESPQAALDGSAYGAVWRVVRALRAHDERLADTLDEHRIRLTMHQEHQPGMLHLPPRWLTVSGVPVTSRFAQAIQVRLVTAGAPQWLDGYARAREFHAGHGHLLIPKGHVTKDGYRLGGWMNDNRNHRREGRLAPDRVARLDALGMVWDVPAWEWERGYAAASAWHAGHGSLAGVPKSHVQDGVRLQAWLSHNRNLRRRGVLDPARAARLDELGIVWDVLRSHWQQHLAAARAFHAGHGHLDVPAGHPPAGGIDLGTWLRYLRDEHANGRLPESRVRELDALGMTWQLRARLWNDAWERNYQALRAFRDEHGHLMLPDGYRAPDGPDLRKWVGHQRRLHRKGTLPPERTAALEQLGLDWDPRGTGWESGLADCTDYHAIHGHLDMEPAHPGTRVKNLTQWLDTRRREYRNGTLRPERAAALDKLGMRWESGPSTARTRKPVQADSCAGGPGAAGSKKG